MSLQGWDPWGPYTQAERDQLARLMKDALDAEEVFSLDELEEFANGIRCAGCGVVGKEIVTRTIANALGGEPYCADCWTSSGPL